MNWRRIEAFIRKTLRLGKLRPMNIAARNPGHVFGRGTYGELKVATFGHKAQLRMGNYCSTARGSQVLLGGGHNIDWVTTFPFSATEPSLSHIEGHPVSRGDVVIGSDVWIATDALILSGVTIGDGAVIMARALVTRDVAPYAIVGGVPAQERGKRFDDRTIERLLAIKWWDWPHERVVSAGPYLLSDDIERFLDLAERGEI